MAAPPIPELLEILEKWSGTLAAQRVTVGLAVLAVAALAAVDRVLRGRVAWALGLLGTAGCVAWGLWRAWKVLWLCDDAYITFHYAQNFANGLGLVFNPGEWVEGYTNFLWAVMLGAAGRAGLDIPRVGLFLNLASFVACLVLAAVTVRRASPSLSEGVAPATVPFAALALAGSSAFATFASSGLETMPAAAWVCLGVAATTTRAAPWLIGLIFTCAALSRPDHVLYGLAMGLALAIEDVSHGEGALLRRLRWHRLLTFAAPFAFVFLPYWLLRWRAYGDFYPNTYYAKSGGALYLEQGGVYLVHFLLTTGAWVGLPVLALLLVGRALFRDDTRLRAFAGASTVLMVAYVTKVGGDFMEHRFYITLLPVVAVAIEVAVRWRWRARLGGAARLGRGVLTGFAGVAAALAVTPVKLIGPYEKKWHLAAEETFYPLRTIYPVAVDTGLFAEGQALAKAFPDPDFKPRYATGCVGMVGYYSKLPLIDTFGLANRRIAHKPISRRGRPGHEKGADFDDVWSEGADISNGLTWQQWPAETNASIPGVPLHLVRWTPRLHAAILKAGGSSPDVDADIARHAGTPDRAAALRALQFYRQFLERDPDRERRLQPLAVRLGEIADFEGSLPPGATVTGGMALRIGPEKPAGMSGEGWLASSGTGTARFLLHPNGATRLRLSMGGPPSTRLGVRLRTASGRVLAELNPQPGDLRTLRLARLELTTGSADELVLEVFDDDPAPGADLAIDAIHFVAAFDLERIARLPTLPPAQLMASLRELEAAVGASEPGVPEAASRLWARYTFDDGRWPAAMQVQGTAWGQPVASALPEQTPVVGAQGAYFLDSYHGADSPKGRVELALPAGRVLVNLLVGGGSDCQLVFAGIQIDGQVRARACGSGDEVLRPVVLEAVVSPEQSAKLVLVDDRDGAWGHLLIDDIMIIQAPEPPRAP